MTGMAICHRSSVISSNLAVAAARLPKTSIPSGVGSRAEDEVRTRDLQLGRLSLYQLSYFRICLFKKLLTGEFPPGRYQSAYPVIPAARYHLMGRNPFYSCQSI